MKYSEYSVVIVGSGAAGLYAALKLSQQINLPDGILLVTKSCLGESNSMYAQGGIVGVVHQNIEDSVALHVDDTLKAGAGLCDRKVVEYISEASDEVINDLIDLGVPFDKNNKGELNFTLEAAHSVRRILHSGGDATGRGITTALCNKVISDENIAKLKPDYMAEEQFKDMIVTCTGYVALANVIQLKGNVGEFLNIIYTSLSFIPKSYDLILQLQELIAGREVIISQDMIGNDKFSAIVYHILNAFVNSKDTPEQFAEDVYQAKLAARKNNLAQIEIFCDLLIGYTYVNLESYKKAASIIYKIIKSVKNQGMYLLQHLGWYFLSEMNLRQKKFDVAYGMLNN